MLSLMLDSTFKNLCLMLPFIGLEQGKVIVEKNMIEKPCIPCCQNVIIICTHQLCKNVIVGQRVDEDCNVDIFEMKKNFK